MAKHAGLQFKLLYKKGTENTATDSLSRVGHNFLMTSVSAVLPV
jgi:hypothetical protein